MAFIPKQAMARDDKLFAIIGANCTLTVAKLEVEILQSKPDFAIENGATIHDAACGLGSVTEAILEADPKLGASVTIHATDIAPPMVGIYNMFAESKGWPSRATIMDYGTFTHTFLSFGLPIIADPIAAVKEMYRTLKPGEIAITAFWLNLAHGESVGETRRQLYGEYPRNQVQIEPHKRHSDPSYIPELLREGGFGADAEIFTETLRVDHPVHDIDQFATAMWSAIGEPKGGWDDAITAYKEVLRRKPGNKIDLIESIAQIAIVKKLWAGDKKNGLSARLH